MKHKVFYIRIINCIIIAALLAGFQAVTTFHKQNEEIAQLTADVTSYKEALSSQASASENTQAADSGSANASTGFKDGTYEGTAAGFGGDITVKVTVKSGKLASIKILSASGEDASYLSSAKKIIDDMLDQQSPDVDTVSGATYSSTGIKNATIRALQKAS